MSDNLITVVVPTYNKQKFIMNTLSSIQNQTYTKWKLLVIDDTSMDETIKIVTKNTDPKRTKIVTHKENKGVCHVLNTALQYIDTKYFIQVDGDDWIAPDTLKLMLKHMEKQPNSTALAYANSIQWKHKFDVDCFVGVKKRKAFQNRYDFVTFSSMVQPRFYRTNCVRRVGGWETNDPSNGRCAEDRRMLLRLLDKYQLSYIDKNLYHMRIDSDNATSSKNAEEYNKVLKYFTDRVLKRWGNLYKAEYEGSPEQFQTVRLVPNKRRN